MSTFSSSVINKTPQYISFRANENLPLTAPINTVQNSLEGTVDTIVTTVDEERNSKSHKKAMAVGAGVLVSALLIAVLNPHYSPKLANKINAFRVKLQNSIETGKNNAMKTALYKSCVSVMEWGNKTADFLYNLSSGKDILFQKLCTEKSSIKSNDSVIKKVFKSIHNGVVCVLKKPHQVITKYGEKLGQFKVKHNYNNALEKMNNLDSLIEKYKSRLGSDEQHEIDSLLQEIKSLKSYYTDSEIKGRLAHQESLMSNLEHDVVEKSNRYFGKLWRKMRGKQYSDTGAHIKENLNFWAKNILEPHAIEIEKAGDTELGKLFANSDGKTGHYSKIINILKNSGKMNDAELKVIDDNFAKTSKSAKNAIQTECVDYFGKKRDLVLGSAPTDIVTALMAITGGGIALGTADDKEELISRSITTVIPGLLGIGMTTALGAMLISGPKNYLISFLSGIGFSRLGSIIDHKVLGHKDEEDEQVAKNTNLKNES